MQNSACCPKIVLQGTLRTAAVVFKQQQQWLKRQKGQMMMAVMGMKKYSCNVMLPTTNSSTAY